MPDQTRPVSPDTPLTAHEAAALDELDQQRTRAEVAEQERDQLRYERRLLGTCRVFLDGLAERGISMNLQRAAADLAQRIVDEIGQAATDEPALGPNLRAEITKLREQLAEAYAAAARSATEADNLRDQLDSIRAVATKSHLWSADGHWPDCPGCLITKVLDAPAAFPGSSRPAQEDPSAPPPGWGYMARVDQLLQRVRQLLDTDVPDPAGMIAALAAAAGRVEAERAKLTPAGITARPGWDPSSPQWAVIRTAINVRKAWADELPEVDLTVAERTMAAAVDALPHIGEIRGEPGPETPASKLAQGGPTTPGVQIHFHPQPPQVRYIPVPYDPRTGRLL